MEFIKIFAFYGMLAGMLAQSIVAAAVLLDRVNDDSRLLAACFIWGGQLAILIGGYVFGRTLYEESTLRRPGHER